MNNNQNVQEFRNLIKKFFDGTINESENEKLHNYYESFQKTNEWVEELGSEEDVRNKMLTRILKSIQKKNVVACNPFYKTSFFKVAIAASIALLLSLSFIYNHTPKFVDTPLVVDAKAITIGTDKATLTLGDGTIVDLENGKSYKTSQVQSNGKEIIYHTAETDKKEVVYNYLTIPRGGQFFLKLSDGTQVWLNSESQLKYPVNFISGETRQVELVYGEAYFDVSPSTSHQGAKFKVVSSTQNITVFGTAFNLKAYMDENEIVTTLVEGKVELEQGENRTFLQPNQKAILKNNTNFLRVEDVDVSADISWIKGLYIFDDTSLDQIMNTLSRWYDFKIDFENPEQQGILFSGVLERSKSIQDILEKLEATGDIDFDIQNNTISIK